MRSVIAMSTAAAMLAAGFPSVPAFAQNAVTPVSLEATSASATIAEMFKSFPNGGEALSNRVADFVVKNPRLAPDLANYVVNTPGLSRAQKIAAEHGVAAALQRLGINAADLGYPTKAPPPPPVIPAVVEEGFNPWGLLLAAALVGGIIACAFECFHQEQEHKPVFVSPN